MKKRRILGKRGIITIPKELRTKLGYSENDVLMFSEGNDGMTVIIRKERICDCVLSSTPTESGNATVTLFDFLNNLTEEQQRAALVHLSLRCASEIGEGV